MVRPFSFLKRQISFVSVGIIDQISSRVSGRKVSFGKICMTKIHDCEPWTDHYSPRVCHDIKTSLFNGDFQSARGLAAIASKEGASWYCVRLMENIIELVASGSEIEFELISFLE